MPVKSTFSRSTSSFSLAMLTLSPPCSDFILLFFKMVFTVASCISGCVVAARLLMFCDSYKTTLSMRVFNVCPEMLMTLLDCDNAMPPNAARD